MASFEAKPVSKEMEAIAAKHGYVAEPTYRGTYRFKKGDFVVSFSRKGYGSIFAHVTTLPHNSRLHFPQLRATVTEAAGLSDYTWWEKSGVPATQIADLILTHVTRKKYLQLLRKATIDTIKDYRKMIKQELKTYDRVEAALRRRSDG